MDLRTQTTGSVPVLSEVDLEARLDAIGEGIDQLKHENAELCRYLELALNVLDRANVAWGGEPTARALIAQARGETA